MTTFWKSTARYYCKYCNTYIADNKHNRELHENGSRHKENVREFMKAKRDARREKEEREKTVNEELEAIKRAADASYQNDISAGYVKVPEPPTDPDVTEAAPQLYSEAEGYSAAAYAAAYAAANPQYYSMAEMAVPQGYAQWKTGDEGPPPPPPPSSMPAYGSSSFGGSAIHDVDEDKIAAWKRKTFGVPEGSAEADEQRLDATTKDDQEGEDERERPVYYQPYVAAPEDEDQEHEDGPDEPPPPPVVDKNTGYGAWQTVVYERVASPPPDDPLGSHHVKMEHEELMTEGTRFKREREASPNSHTSETPKLDPAEDTGEWRVHEVDEEVQTPHTNYSSDEEAAPVVFKKRTRPRKRPKMRARSNPFS